MEPDARRATVDAFHELYYDSQPWKQTYWLGTPTEKCPLDLWVYQEIFAELRPDLVIETGTRFGGSAYFMASLFDLLGCGRIVTIDIEDLPRPDHPRITYVSGHSSTSPYAVTQVEQAAEGAGTVMVVLDSDHSRDHVFDELTTYHGLVTPGSYLVVEDTNVNGHPVLADFGPGPMEAIDDFLPAHPAFVVDQTREKFFLTFNPRGYLRRVR